MHAVKHDQPEDQPPEVFCAGTLICPVCDTLIESQIAPSLWEDEPWPACCGVRSWLVKAWAGGGTLTVTARPPAQENSD